MGDQEETRGLGGGGREMKILFSGILVEAPEGEYSPPSLAPNGTLST